MYVYDNKYKHAISRSTSQLQVEKPKKPGAFADVLLKFMEKPFSGAVLDIFRFFFESSKPKPPLPGNEEDLRRFKNEWLQIVDIIYFKGKGVPDECIPPPMPTEDDETKEEEEQKRREKSQKMTNPKKKKKKRKKK